MTNVRELVHDFGRSNRACFDMLKELNGRFEALTEGEQQELRELVGDSPIGALVMVVGASQRIDPGARSMILTMYVPHLKGRDDPLMPKMESLFAGLFGQTEPGLAMAIVLQIVSSFVHGVQTDPLAASSYLARRVLEYGESASVEMHKKMQDMLQKAMEGRKPGPETASREGGPAECAEGEAG